MSALMINVKIELAECHKEVELEKIVKGADGSLIMAIDLNDATNIDKCESAVLDVIYPSIRSTLTDHLSSVSEQLAIQKAGTTSEVVANETPYRVDGEAGRFTFTTHSVFEEGKLVYNTASDEFQPLIGKGYYRTAGFKQLSMMEGDVEQSFRKTAASINRTRRQEVGGTPFRTLRDNTESEGAELIDYIEMKTDRILEENDFTKEGEY